MDTVSISKELYAELVKGLHRIDNGYLELSQNKIDGEYKYYKKLARELRLKLKAEAEKQSESPNA